MQFTKASWTDKQKLKVSEVESKQFKSFSPKLIYFWIANYLFLHPKKSFLENNLIIPW